MIEMVSLAEDFIARNRKTVAVGATAPASALQSPRSRRSCAERAARKTTSRRRLAPAHRRISRRRRYTEFPQNKDLARLSESGVVTPDHTIRTKNWPLVLPALQPGKLEEFAHAAREAAQKIRGALSPTISNVTMPASAAIKQELDPLPRVVLVPGLGLFGLGRSKRDAVIAADIAEAWIEGVSDAESIGRFESISEADMFDCEYWPLEQAKLGKRKELPLAGQIAADYRRRRRDRRGNRQGLRGGRRGSRPARRQSRRRARASQAIGPTALAVRMRRDQCGLGERGVRSGRGGVRRRRHRGLECRRRLAGPHRRSRRGNSA